MKKIGVLVGSLRKESYSKKIAANVAEMFPASYEITFIEMNDLAFYDQDFDDENNIPGAYADFRAETKKIDAFLFVTPEYNRSVPALLKNAIDVGSRPKADNVWDGKPAAIISQSPGVLGGFGANHHLRQTLTGVNMTVVQHPEVYLSDVGKLLDKDGKINNQGTTNFLQSFIDTFIELINPS